MHAPVDYPIDDAARTAQFSMDELMYAALLDRIPATAAEELPPAVVQNGLLFDIALYQPAEEKPERQPLAAIAHTLLAGEYANTASGVLSRWTRAGR